jgi:site-specific DNA recombinase
MIAEYERAKIMERNRRGKLHRARKGSVNVLSGAPYGYLYVKKSDTQDAHYVVIDDEAAVVRKIFHWYTVDQFSIGWICRKLREDGVPTRTGLVRWDRSVVWGILRNPAYAGRACYGKTESVQRITSNRVARTGTGLPRRLKSSSRQKPEEQWIPVQVPEIVTESTFGAAHEQLQRNKKFAERNRKGGQYLLRGLLVCRRCAYSLYAKPLSPSCRKGHVRHYAYYRCVGTDSYRFADGPVCDNRQVRTDELDNAIWDSVLELLNEPERVLNEFGRRQMADGMDLGLMKNQKDSLLRAKKKAEASIQRLFDAYQAGVLDLEELKPRTAKLRDKIRVLDEQISQSEQAIAGTLELREVVTRLADFKARMADGLEKMAFDERCKLVRLLVDRVEVDRDDINVIYRVGAGHA